MTTDDEADILDICLRLRDAARRCGHPELFDAAVRVHCAELIAAEIRALRLALAPPAPGTGVNGHAKPPAMTVAEVQQALETRGHDVDGTVLRAISHDELQASGLWALGLRPHPPEILLVHLDG